jgi:transposase
MKGYHYLMRIGHLLNVLALYSTQLADLVQELGPRALIRFIRQTLSVPWLDHERVRQRLARNRQLRLAAPP